jgi:hypothetical protein
MFPRAFPSSYSFPVETGQDKLPEADFAVEAFNPADVVRAVQTILAGNC